uniref:type I protein arginine methyltransferase n=1 Tax=Varanus komodoensis TaxID=61221 RepID=A0A8D2Q4Q2_VARKO
MSCRAAEAVGRSPRVPEGSLARVSLGGAHFCPLVIAGEVPAAEGGGSEDEPCWSDSGSESAWEEDDEDPESRGPAGRARCLFCDRFFSSAEDAFCHCTSDHGFNIGMLAHKHRLDFYGYIKLVNFIRLEKPAVEYLCTISSPFPWEEEKYLKPALEDDLLLQFGKVSFNLKFVVSLHQYKHCCVLIVYSSKDSA